jgi:ketosteroid isomerase-like protein
VSRQNVEVVLDVFRALRERDNEGMFANYATDIEWDLSRYSGGWTGEPLFRGHDGVREFWRQWFDAFTCYEAHALDPLAVGDRVLVTVVERAEGKQSGVPVERVHGQVWTLRDGLVVRIQVLDSRAEALKVMGLEE